MRKSKLLWIFVSSLVIVSLAVLGLLARLRRQQPDLAYDSHATSVVIYADMRWYPGATPPDQPCLGQFFPRLRVWGDGLVFLDVSQAGLEGPVQWSGNLTSAQLQSALETLNANGFFSGLTPGIPNPAGTWLRIGVHLQTKSFEYQMGDLNPTLYVQLIDQIKPHLKPINQQEEMDSRIKSILAVIQSCIQ